MGHRVDSDRRVKARGLSGKLFVDAVVGGG
jgi:hypothetical protein